MLENLIIKNDKIKSKFRDIFLLVLVILFIIPIFADKINALNVFLLLVGVFLFDIFLLYHTTFLKVYDNGIKVRESGFFKHIICRTIFYDNIEKIANEEEQKFVLSRFNPRHIQRPYLKIYLRNGKILKITLEFLPNYRKLMSKINSFL